MEGNESDLIVHVSLSMAKHSFTTNCNMINELLALPQSWHYNA